MLTAKELQVAERLIRAEDHKSVFKCKKAVSVSRTWGRQGWDHTKGYGKRTSVRPPGAEKVPQTLLDLVGQQGGVIKQNPTEAPYVKSEVGTKPP